MRIKAFISLIITVVIVLAVTFSGCSKKENNGTGKQAGQLPAGQPDAKKNLEEARTMNAATVNGIPITMYSLVQKMNVIAPRYIKPGQRLDSNIEKKITQLALDRLIFEELAVQEARRHGFTVKVETVEDVIKRIKAGYGTQKEYNDYLESRGVTEEMLRTVIERGSLIEMITAKEVYGKITVNEAALKNEYEKEKLQFVTSDDPPRQKTFEEVRGLLERKIKSETGAENLKIWEKELKKNAKIVITLQKGKG